MTGWKLVLVADYVGGGAARECRVVWLILRAGRNHLMCEKKYGEKHVCHFSTSAHGGVGAACICAAWRSWWPGKSIISHLAA